MYIEKKECSTIDWSDNNLFIVIHMTIDLYNQLHSTICAHQLSMHSLKKPFDLRKNTLVLLVPPVCQRPNKLPMYDHCNVLAKYPAIVERITRESGSHEREKRVRGMESKVYIPC
jgi:hypothetical protein